LFTTETTTTTTPTENDVLEGNFVTTATQKLWRT